MGGFFSYPPYYLGNQKNPQAYVLVNYCGGGYFSNCVLLEEKLEARFPGKFQLVCYPDAEETGRFEVTLFKSLNDLNLKMNGLEVHSKAETKRLPSFDENNTFMQIMKKF